MNATVTRTSQLKIAHNPELMADLDFTHRALAGKFQAFFDLLLDARNEDPATSLLRQFHDSVVSDSHNIVAGHVSALYQSGSPIGTSSRRNKKSGELNPIHPGKILCRKLLDLGVFPVVPDDLPLQAFYKAAWVAAFSAYRSWHDRDLAQQAKYREMEKSLKQLATEIETLPAEVQSRMRTWVEQMESQGYRINGAFLKKWPMTRRSLRAGEEPRSYEARLFDGVPLEHVSLFANERSLRSKIENTLPGARVPQWGQTNISMLMSVSGANAVPVSLESHDGVFCGTMTLVNHAAPDQVVRHQFRCLRSQYFLDLKAATVASGSTTVCEATYHKGNSDRTPVKATIKEPRIRRVGQDWVLDCVQNVEVSGQAPDIGYFFGKDKPVPDCLRVMAVDLGVNPLATYSVYSLEATPGHESIQVGDSGFANKSVVAKVGGIRDRDFHTQVLAFRDRMVALKRIVRYRCDVLNGRPINDKRLKAISESASSLDILLDGDLKRVLLDTLSTFREEFARLRDNPTRRTGLASEQFSWILAVREYLSLQQAWKYGGVKTDRPRTQGDFAHLWKYFNNLKRDLIKKTAAAIRQAAQRHQVDAVLVEDLEGFHEAVDTEKGTNSFLAIWSPRSILDQIENALSPHGIRVVTIDPRMSSQLDPHTLEFGFRDRAAKSVLLVRRDDGIHALDADVSATQILQQRFWTRYEEVHYLDCVETQDGFIPRLKKRAGSFVKRVTGSNFAVIRNGRLLPVKRETVVPRGDVERLYRHQNTWVDYGEHRRLLDGILAEYAGQASLGAEGKAYLSRLKSAPWFKLRKRA